MHDPTRPQLQPTNPFLEQLCERSQDPFRNGQIMELSAKIDRLIEMLIPPRSAIITGPQVERVIKQIEKARGRA